MAKTGTSGFSTKHMLNLAVVAAGALLLGQAAQASTIAWNGGSATNGNWSNTANWTGGTAPGATTLLTNNDVALFNAAIANTWGSSTGTPIVIDSTSENIGNISFGTNNVGSYVVGSTGGNSLLLTNAGTTTILSTVTTAAVTETINAPLVLEAASATTAGAYTFSNNGTGTQLLNLGGPISGGSTSAAVTMTLSGTNTGNNTISGVISNGAATGGLAVTQSGTGTWILSGANTYTGATTVSNGTLAITGALGNTAVTVNSGVLQLNAGSAMSQNTLIVNGGSVTENATNSLSGTMALTMQGPYAGGTVTLSSPNNYTGATNVNNGILTLTAAGATGTSVVTVNGGSAILQLNAASAITQGTITVNGFGKVTENTDNALSGTAALTLTYGTASLTNANNYTGTTTVNNNCTLTVSGKLGNTPVNVGGTLQLNGPSAISQNVLTLTGTGAVVTENTDNAISGNTTVVMNYGSMTLSNANNYTGATTLNSGTLTLSASGAIGKSSSVTVGNGTLQLNAPSAISQNNLLIQNGTVTESVANALSGTMSLTTSYGSPSVTLSAANTYTGATNLSNGTITLNAAGAIGNSLVTVSGATLVLGNAAAIGTNPVTFTSGNLQSNIVLTGANKVTNNLVCTGNITINGTNALEIGGTFTNSGGDRTLNFSDSGGVTVSGNVYLSETSNVSRTLYLGGTGNALISGSIANAPPGVGAMSNLNYQGTGSVTLAGSNTYNGTTTVSSGTLILGNANALGKTFGAAGGPNWPTLVVNNGSATAGTLDLHGFSPNANSLAGSTGTVAGQIVNNASGTNVTLTIGNPGSASSYSYYGNILNNNNSGTGTIALTKAGTTTETLAGLNTYTGATTINAGTLIEDLSVFASAGISSSSNLLLNGGTLSLKGHAGSVNSQTFSGVSYAGGIILLNDNTGTSTTLTANTLARSGRGTLIVGAGSTTSLGSTEFMKVATNAPSVANAGIVNGMVNPSIVSQGTTTAKLGDFLTYDSTNGFIAATAAYTPFNAGGTYTPTSTQIANVTATGTLAANGTAYALLVGNGAAAVTATLAGTFNVGDNTSGHQAGLIINANTTPNNNTTITGGTLNFGASEGVISNFDPNNKTNSLNSPIAGTGGVTLALGSTTLSIGTAASTFTGGLTINNGTLRYGSADNGTSTGPLGNIANIITLNGGTLFDYAGDSVLANSQHAIVLNAGGGTFNGNNRSTSFAGNISGVGALTINITNAAFMTFSGNNTYSGGTNLVQGTLSIATDANIGGPTAPIAFQGGNIEVTGTTLTSFGSHPVALSTGNTSMIIDIANAANTFTLSQSLVMALNAGGTAFSKTGAGTLALTAANTQYNIGGGDTTDINGGVLKVDASQGGSLSFNSATSSKMGFGGGTLWYLGNSTGASTQTIGNIIGNSGGGTILVDNNSGSGTTTVNLGALTTFSTGSALNLKTANAGTGAAVITTTSTNDATGIVGMGRVVFNGTDWAAATAGTINAYSGYTVLPASGATSTLNYSQADSASVSASQTVNTLKITTSTSGGSLAIGSGQTLTVNNGGLLFTGANDYSITGGALATNVSTNATDLVVNQFGSGKLTIGSVIQNAAVPTSVTGNATNGSSTITSMTSTANLAPGYTVTIGGTNYTISSVNSATQITLTANFTGTTSTGAALSFTSLNQLTKAGPGTLILTNANTYTGQTYVIGGVLSVGTNAELGGSGTAQLNLNGGTLQTTATFSTARNVQFGGSGGAFDVADGTILTVTGSISAALSTGNGFGAGGLTLNSTSGANGGILVLSAGNVFGGGITINNGTLRLNASAAINAGGVNNIIFGSSTTTGVLQLNSISPTINGLAGPAGAAVENGNSSNTAVTLTVNMGDNETFAGTLRDGTVSAGKGLSIIKGGSGTWTVSGTNTYTGKTSLFNGILALGSSGALTSTLTSTTTNNITFGSDTVTSTFGGTLQFSSANNLDYSARIKNSSAPMALDTNGQSVTFTTPLASTNTGGLNKLGTGTLTLAATDGYAGGTTVNAGTLAISADASLGTSPAVTVNNGTLDFTTGFSSNLNITLGSGSPALQVDLGNLVLNNALAGSSLTKTGNAKLTLASASSYTGPTTINAGTLAISADAALGSNSSLTVNNGTLELTSNFSFSRTVSLGTGSPTIQIDSGTQTLAWNGTGSLSKAGSGQLTLATLPSAVSVSNGILQLTTAGSSHTLETLSSLTISGGTLDLTNHDLFISGGAASLSSLINNKITSSGTNPTALSTTTIALMSGNEYMALGKTTLGSGPTLTNVSGGDLVGVLAYAGDANLDGKISADDYLALNLGYMFHLSGWTHGDFDQDGTIGVDDFAAIDNNLAHQGVSVADSEIALHTQWFGAAYTDAFNALNAPAAVPEPASLALLGLGAVALLKRRR